jgi:hypothetical protein
MQLALDGTRTGGARCGHVTGTDGHRRDRVAFVLHIIDELIHHGAEVALLRDLHHARSGGGVSAE